LPLDIGEEWAYGGFVRDPRRLRLGLLALLSVTALLAVGTAAAQSAPLLPDLDPAAPGKPKPYAGTDGLVYLTFNARFDNVGAGPLVLRASRASTAQPTMTVNQIVKQTDGTEATVPNVGGVVYDAEYRRWGFLPFIRYELLGTDGSPVGAGPDMNFCVMDTQNSDSNVVLPGEPAAAVYTESGACQKRKPSILSTELGISVGWGNMHTAGKKGQMIPISGLPSGRYIVVHRVNTSGVLSEANLSNNASSALIQVTWVAGSTLPTVKTIRSCANTPVCS
jgi:hypothetical protein